MVDDSGEQVECQIQNPTYAKPKLRAQDKAANELAPTATACQDGLPYSDYLILSATGTAVWTCHSEPIVPLDQHQTLAYGKSWSKGGLSCSSSPNGIKCRNKAGHGFELSRSRYKLF